MAASFPENVKSFDTRVDGQGNIIYAQHVNDIQDEIAALETQAQRTMFLGHFATTKTLTGTETLTDASKPILYLDPGGANRDVKLAPEANTNHGTILVNTADADEKLVVKDDSGTTTIVEIGQGKARMVIPNGTAWKVLSGGGGITVEEEDGTPSVSDVTEIKVSNGTLTDNGSGSVSVSTGGSGGGGDIVATLVNSEVSITAAITLTSTAFGKMHKISDAGTPADYTVTLPAASGNAGKIIGLRVAGNATKLFTIDGNGSETIDGETVRVLWAGEVAILECDGTGWTKIAGKTIPMMCRLENHSTPQTIVNATFTVVQHDTEVFDIGNIGDFANNRITLRRPGKVRIFYQNRWTLLSAARVVALLQKNGSGVMSDERYASSTNISNVIATIVDVVAADYIDVRAYQNSGASKDIIGGSGTEYPNMVVEEIVTW